MVTRTLTEGYDGADAGRPPTVLSARGHDVDRALRELLEEDRIAQMGGQILLGFLLAVAYTPVMSDATAADRSLYAAAVLVTTAAVVLLLATVPLHRMNFGRRQRPEILVVGHVLTMLGIVLLATAIVLGVWLAARFAVPDLAPTMVGTTIVLVVLCWIVVPLWLRMRTGRREVEGS